MNRLICSIVLFVVVVACREQLREKPTIAPNFSLDQNIILFKNDSNGRPLSIAAQQRIIDQVNNIKPTGRADIKIVKRCRCDSSLVLLEGRGLDNIRIRDGGTVASSTDPRGGVSGSGDLEAIKSNGDSIVIPQLLSSGTRNYFTTLPPAITRARIKENTKYGRKLPDVSPAAKGNFIVGVIDTGLNPEWLKPGIVQRLWRNPAEQGGTADSDDDNNGFPDDMVGWNFVDDNNNPVDSLFHGTLVTGLIDEQVMSRRGAGEQVRYMILRTHDNNGQSKLFDNLCAMSYARKNGAKIINASWGFYDQNSSPLLTYFLRELRDHGVLFVAAAGNAEAEADTLAHNQGIPATDYRNLARHRFWPAGADTINNVIAVTTITGKGAQSYGRSGMAVCITQNWSAPHVDVGVANPGMACGVNGILTVPGRPDDVGSSYAAPVVTGKLAAFLWQTWPESHEQTVLDKLKAINTALLPNDPSLRRFVRKEQYIKRIDGGTTL